MTKLQVRPVDRQKILLQRRHLKMAESAHAYVRGNTLRFYEWLESVDAAKLIPDGPPIWICGDCHIGNLGPVANSEGRVEIQIRDLDQTVIGNPAHDLIRLGLSLAMAARSSDLPGVTTAHVVQQLIEGYEQALEGKQPDLKTAKIAPIQVVLRQALKRKWRHLAEERIEDVRPQIPLGRRFWAITRDEKAAISAIFREEDTRKLITSLKSRDDGERVEVIDAAYWMKGCSSLGRLRFAVLVGLGKDGKNGYCLVDIKQAAQAAAPQFRNAKMPKNNAERVVQGARALAPFLGDRMRATQLNDKPVFLRELMPQDLKFDLEDLSQDETVASAKLFATVVGRAHANQMDKKTRKAWLNELKRNRSKSLEAPSWLWSSIVDLVASHEAAYLEHCRRYALGISV